MAFKMVNNKDYDYWKKNKPRTIWWEVVAPKGYVLNPLMDHDLIFDDYDLKIRKLI